MRVDFLTNLTHSFKEHTDLIKTGLAIVVGQLMVIAATLLALAITYFGWADNLLGWLIYALCLVWFVAGIAVTVAPFNPNRR